MTRPQPLITLLLTGVAMLAFTGCRTTVVEQPAPHPDPQHYDDHHDDHKPPPPAPDHRDDRH